MAIGLRLGSVASKAWGGEASSSRALDNWQPPAGYVKNVDGTVTHTSSGDVFQPVYISNGQVRTNSSGEPIFQTTSGGSTAHTTLTNSSASGQTIYVAPDSGRNGSVYGSVGDANFAQTTIRSDRTFSAEGQQIYSDIAGYPIRTVDDLSGALRRGDINPSDVPVDFVDMNGSRLILNTRTSTALQDAGIPQSQWFGTQRTGQTAYIDPTGNPVTYNDLATNQLNNNNLPPTGSPTLPGSH